MATDQEIRDAGYKFISPQQYLQNPFVIPTEEEEVTETFGIPYTGAFTRSGGGGGGGGAPINYQTDRNYRPGGRYERNPLFSGVMSTTVGQDRFGNDKIVPNYGMRDELSPLQLAYGNTEVEHPENLSRFERLNLKARDLFGVNSAYETARKTGKIGDLIQGIVPFQNVPKMLGGKPVGDWSPRRRWAVEGGEWGTGTGRDEWGVYTGDKTLTGKTGDYSERMGNRVNELRDFFGIGTTPLQNLTSQQIAGMKNKNNANFNQLLDYETKQGLLKEDEQKEVLERQDKTRQAAMNIRRGPDKYNPLSDKYESIGPSLHGEGKVTTDDNKSDGQVGGQTTQAAADLAGDSWENSPFAQGGLIRKAEGGRAHFENGIASII